MNIELYIDELLLIGFAPTDGAAIAAATERELLQLLTRQGLPPGLWGSTAVQFDGRGVTTVPYSSPETLGIQIAQAIYGGLHP
jgi:hypothetical protein